MCTPYITYHHKCTSDSGSWRVVFTDPRQVCTFCKERCRALLAAGKAVPARAASSGQGGLTGRPYAAAATGQSPS